VKTGVAIILAASLGSCGKADYHPDDSKYDTPRVPEEPYDHRPWMLYRTNIDGNTRIYMATFNNWSDDGADSHIFNQGNCKYSADLLQKEVDRIARGRKGLIKYWCEPAARKSS
jgi:hypothetical protein